MNDFFGEGGNNRYPNGNNNNNNNGNGGGNNNNNNRQNLVLFLIAALVTLLIVSYLMSSLSSSTVREISYTQFINWVDNDYVASVEMTSDRINITLKDEVLKQFGTSDGSISIFDLYAQNNTTYYTALIQDDTLTARLLYHNVDIKGEVSSSSTLILSFLLTYILPIVLMWALLSLLFRRMNKGGGIMGVGKSNAKVYGQKDTGVTFKDVAGEDEAKESLVEVVDFLHNPGKYSQIGAKLPKGALLVGPPGTGKTLLAKAVAGEANVPFYSMTGSDFVELYVGVGASRVRDLFKEAEKNAPCIIFIDEIDAIGRSRDSKYGGGNDEREQTLNQLLSEMDGFDGKKGIIILAATNRPEILDKALLRPGRFDRRIIVDKPDLKGRVEILKVHSKDVLMDDTVDLNEIALATSGAVGSDLANMINEAAINAVKMGRKAVSQKDLFDAVEQVLVGKEKKDRIMSKKEREIVSYHEIGHALVAALQKNSEPVQKITIVPRTMGALGYVMQVPEEEKFLNTEAELRDMLVGYLGGRAAEEIVFDTVTTGASNDIEKATKVARAMVTQYGMSKKFGLMGLETVESQYLEGRTAMNCSDRTAADVDTEVMNLLKESYEEALRLLRENRELLDKLAAHLIEKETITGKEFMEIYRREKGLPEPEEKKAEEDSEKAANASATQTAETTAAPSQVNPADTTVAQADPEKSGNTETVAQPSPQVTATAQQAYLNAQQSYQQTPETSQANPYQDGRYVGGQQAQASEPGSQASAPQADPNQTSSVQGSAQTGRFSQVSENAIHHPKNTDASQE